VKRSSLTLAALALTVAAALPASAQVNTGSITAFPRGTFNLAEAYPCAPGTFPDNLGLTPLQTFTGKCGAQAGPAGAAPGILCLKRPTDSHGVPTSFALDVNCFAITPPGETGCFVQAYRLTKQVPGSFKCPDVYGLPHFDKDGNLLPYQYFQFGTGVRTWWALNFTQPGTKFILEVVSACQFQPTETVIVGGVTSVIPVPGTGVQTHIHKDVWTWQVVADETTLLNVINLMHDGAVGTLEIPCIIGEDMYDALVKAQSTLATDIEKTTTDSAGHTVRVHNLTDIGNDIFNMEALVASNCLFTEILNPLVFFNGPQQFGAPNIILPGNLAPTVSFDSGGTAIAGIIDTTEHPCCCKLLVDLEWISIGQGLVGQTPSLPVF
jgi:hypothetical protein